jgi:ADP-heptose:LPS heptosyltransferase
MIGPQLFWEPFEFRRIDYRYDVAFHFRSILRADLDIKNYPIEYARELINRCKATGIRVCCIGHPQYSLGPDNCDDLRSGDLSETRMALKSIKVVAGGSSAPMHLASLCGLPIVTWWKAAPFDLELRDKYLDLWNPHKVPVCVVSESTFQPAPEQVFSGIIKALDSISC